MSTKSEGENLFKAKKTETSNKTKRLPNELVHRLEEWASQSDISFNQVIIQCCEYALQNLDTESTSLACKSNWPCSI